MTVKKIITKVPAQTVVKYMDDREIPFYTKFDAVASNLTALLMKNSGGTLEYEAARSAAYTVLTHIDKVNACIKDVEDESQSKDS